MNALLPFVILGITAGSVYGLTGTGLVLTYKTSGIFNFAQGAVATTGAYVSYLLHAVVLPLPAVPTTLICVFLVGPVLGLGMEAMARRLADASATMKVVATIGLVLVVQGFFSATFGTLARTFPAWLPQHTVKVGGVFVGEDQMIITGTALAGPPGSMPFIVLCLVLIFTPRSRLADRRVSRPRPAAVYAAPARVQIAGAVVVGAVLLVVPHLVNSAQLPYWSDGMTQVILFLSLGLLVRTSGQVSLCQAAFAAIGATTMGHLTAGFGLPWGVALLLAGLAAVPIGAFIAIPAIPLPGGFPALATFGVGVTMQQMGYPLWLMFGSSSLGQPRNPP